ncbi:hypothetical protein NIES2098_07970 [Calothrix sp. NIES-2098]|nr:hypothetical protein NIES2098_07970 [Calothrix sp. NIES-2098]
MMLHKTSVNSILHLQNPPLSTRIKRGKLTDTIDNSLRTRSNAPTTFEQTEASV